MVYTDINDISKTIISRSLLPNDKKGIGVSQDYTKAVEWYQKSAEQRNDKAQYNLVAMYENGVVVDRDFSEAIEWYKKSAV